MTYHARIDWSNPQPALRQPGKDHILPIGPGCTHCGSLRLIVTTGEHAGQLVCCVCGQWVNFEHWRQQRRRLARRAEGGE